MFVFVVNTMKISSANNNLFIKNSNFKHRPKFLSACYTIDVLELKSKSVSFSGISEKKKLKKEANEYAANAQILKKESFGVIAGANVSKHSAEMMFRISQNIKNMYEREFPFFKGLLEENLSKSVCEYSSGNLKYLVEKQDENIVVTTILPSRGTSICTFDLNGKLVKYLDNVQITDEGLFSKMRMLYSEDGIQSVDEGYSQIHTSGEFSKQRYIFDEDVIDTVYHEYKDEINKPSEINAEECFKFNKGEFKTYFKDYSLLSGEIELSGREFDFEKDLICPQLIAYKEANGRQNGNEFGRFIYKFKQGKLANVSVMQHLTPSKNIEKLEYFIFDDNEKPKHYFKNCGGRSEGGFDYWEKSINLGGLF